MFTKQIRTIDDVKKFFDYLFEVEKVNFHPDEDFSTYISIETEEPTFSKSEADHYNSLMSIAFDICENNNVDVYELSMRCLKSYTVKD